MTVTRPVRSLVALAALSITAAPALSAVTVEVDAAIKPYEAVSGVSGKLNSIGSDTLNNLMGLWAEGFRAKYPNVKIEIEGKGSSTAPPALIEGAAQLGPMSRAMKKEEIDKFEAKFGYKPTEIKVAIDALAVFVHKDNPIKAMTMEQVDGIFSATRKRGGQDLSDWGMLIPEWKGKAFSLYGRNSASGTYGFFKEVVLKGGDYKASVKEQPGSSAVVSGVAGDMSGIGYSGIGYVTSGVHTLALGESGKEPAEPSYDNCLNGKYPLARFLYVYINKAPNRPAPPLVGEFVKFMSSREGQEIVIKDHYFPLPAQVAQANAAAVQ